MAVPRESRRWSDEQLRNARVIINVGRQVGASQRDILIALMVAFQESGMRNLNYGDRDSVGLFQQRAGWGSYTQRMDPIQSARMFFTGGHRPGTPGLLDIRSRNQMSLTRAAQAVQRSAFPDAYAKHEGRANDILRMLGVSTNFVEPSRGLTPLQPDYPMPAPTQPALPKIEPPKPMEPLGLEAPKPDAELAPGLKSPAAPGIEAGNTLPAMGMGTGSVATGVFEGTQGPSDFFLPPPTTGGSARRGNYNLPGVKPWVLDAANELGGQFGIKTVYGVAQRERASDHPGGLALDFMTKSGPGNSLSQFAMANAARLGIKYIIWRQRIWSVARASEGWRLMKDRGSPTANHMDHVHISFNAR